jgi:hypothetical protein
VRWIEYAAIVLILGAAAVIGVFMLRGGEDEVAFETFDRHELAEAAKLGVGEEGVGSAALPISPVSYESHVALRQAGALAVVPITPVSYESHVALRQAGALAVVPISPVSYESHVALRQAGALAVVPISPVSYESHAALREAGALAIVPVTPVSYESNVALREAGAPFEASSDTFETTYEAASGLSMGARHTDPSFAVGIRYVGVSDMTLEEFELPG